MRKYLLLLSLLGFVLPASAQVYTLTGQVTDNNNKALPFASVYIRNSTYGTVANEQGHYQLKLTAGDYNIVYREPGYKEQVEKITIGNANAQRNVKMIDEAYVLKQITGLAGQSVDSAAGIIQQVISRRKFYLRQVHAYTCVEYIKGMQKLVRAPVALMSPSVVNALSVDSTGKGVLFQTESLSNFSFEQPDNKKEEMIATISAGQNAAFAYNKASDLAADFYKDFFYVQGLSSHSFVSPLGSYGPDFYNYYLVGSKIENGIIIHKIQVTPKRSYDPAFTGYVYIADGYWRIYGVDLMLTGKANALNLVDTMRISQEYVPIRDSVWMPLSIQYNFNGKVLGFQFEGYYLGIYNDYKIDTTFAPGYFNGQRLKIDSSSVSHSLAYWQNIRPVPLTPQESRDYANKADMAAMKEAMENSGVINEGKNHFMVLPYIPFGYKAAFNHHHDSLYVQPFIQTVFYNTVQGGGINLKGSYVHYLDTIRSYSITPNARYGFSDKIFTANLLAFYNYDPLKRGKFILNFGSDILDLSNVGTRSLYFNTLSTLLSEQNYVKYYKSSFVSGGFEHNLGINILWQAGLSYADRTQLYNTSFYYINSFAGRRLTSNNPLMPDAPANDHSLLFPQNQALTFSTDLTYTFGQEYIDRPTGRDYLPSDYPQIRLNYRKGINGALGSDVDYDFASLEVFKENMNNGLLGFSSFKFVAGDFFNHNKLYFMDYNHFQGNEGTTFDPTPGSFHFLPFYTYSTGGPFLEAHYEHNFSGFLFSKVPFLRRAKLDEIIGVNYLATNQNRNYSEYYIGIQRFIFRVDYGISFEGNKRYLQGFRIFYGIR
ncbi:MAG: carboxypeptidase-like regulatory domain-containing protein [Bacteroidetes bacterium]|nr:carboxypeptidase-like regulatory domain-containing protein [Bacteroidota bacterium]